MAIQGVGGGANELWQPIGPRAAEKAEMLRVLDELYRELGELWEGDVSPDKLSALLKKLEPILNKVLEKAEKVFGVNSPITIRLGKIFGEFQAGIAHPEIDPSGSIELMLDDLQKTESAISNS